MSSGIMQGESNYINKGRIAAILIPGLIQYQNDQIEKSIIFISWIFGFIFCWYFWYLDDPSGSIILIVSGLTYVYSIVDSLIIYNGLKRKRRSISDDAEKYFNKPHNGARKTYYRSNIEKGEKFEKFVLKKFDTKDFSIFKMTSPFQWLDTHYNENNLDPDFILRFIPSREKFAVEAKWRSNRDNSEIIQWCKDYQMPRYKRFEDEEKIPVYIVIGLGGIPDNPNKMFLVPLENVNSHELSLEFLSKNEMNPNSNFMWRPGSFWNSGHLKTKRPPRESGG